MKGQNIKTKIVIPKNIIIKNIFLKEVFKLY